MKRKVIALLVICVMVLSGCGKTTPEEKSEETVQDIQQKEIADDFEELMEGTRELYEKAAENKLLDSLEFQKQVIDYLGQKGYAAVDMKDQVDMVHSEQVDFDKLVQENPDTVAWLRFDQPSIISYPVVKSADNNEYLTKTFSANDNKLGAIFMDMRNQNDFSDRNTFIYGHNMKVGGEMFSQLNEYASEDFYKAHPYFYIYTPDGKTRTYEVFSAGVVKDSAEVYNLNITTDEEFEAYLAECKSTSNYVTSPGVDRNSKIVSLSTCTNVNEDERFLLQGVLIKEE